MLIYYKSFKEKEFCFSLSPILIIIIFVITKHLLIYRPETSDTRIEVQFFHFYNIFGQGYTNTSILFIALILSALFPIVLLARNKSFLKEKTIQFSLPLVLFSIFIANTLTETSERENHGNFLWQIFICMYLLFFCCIFALLKHKTKNKKFTLELILFSMHFISGIII